MKIGNTQVTRRRFLVSATSAVTLGALGTVPYSWDSKLSKLQDKCDANIMRAKDKIARGQKLPIHSQKTAERWLEEFVGDLNNCSQYRHSLDPRFLWCDIGLDELNQEDKEIFVGRCGGFATHFIEETSKVGFSPVRLCLVSGCKDPGPRDTHFFGMVDYDKHHYLLSGGPPGLFEIKDDWNSERLLRNNFTYYWDVVYSE